MRKRTNRGTRNLIGSYIVQTRKKKGLGQGELLSKIQLLGSDMTQAKLSRIEGQMVVLTDRDLLIIAKALDVSLDELCEQEMERLCLGNTHNNEQNTE